MGFAQTHSTDKYHAGLVLEERQPEEVLHLGLIDLFGPSPVELFERFDNREASGSHPSNDLPLMAALSFPFDEPGQILQGGPLLARRFVSQPLIMLGHEGQIECFQLLGQTEFVIFHGVGDWGWLFGLWS